jgi:DNA mismatch endonuclease Vsr
MVDNLSTRDRSAFMARIRSKDTRPELVVRKLLHLMGYRYRLHAKGVPGRPDVAFPRRRKAVFVHGCFWHAYEGCPFAHVPKTRPDGIAPFPWRQDAPTRLRHLWRGGPKLRSRSRYRPTARRAVLSEHRAADIS